MEYFNYGTYIYGMGIQEKNEAIKESKKYKKQ